MGQKANINSLHLSRTKDWNSVWYTNNKEYSKILVEDLIMLNYLKSCSLSSELTEVVKIRICRLSKDVIINLQLTTKLDTNSVSKLKEIVSNLNKIFPNF